MSNGEFVWYDFMASDVDKAIAFYGEAVGYKTQAWGDDGYQMWMINGGENSVGGVMQLPEQAAKMGAPPHWLSYVAVDDADAIAAKTSELGGNVLQPGFDIPDVGRIAVLQDPHGAVFGVVAFEGDGMDRPDPSQVGAFCWAELWAGDLDSAWDFYNSLFGWEKADAMDMGDDMGTYQMFGNGGEMAFGGMMTKPAEMPMAAWTYCITTDDLDAAIGRVEGNGGSVMNGPMDVPNGRVCYFTDSQGGAFALYQLTAEG